MIRSLELNGKSKDDISNFIFEISPYGDPKNEELRKLTELVNNDPKYYHVASVGEVDRPSQSEKYFMIWRNFDNSKLFGGIVFVPFTEADTGINFKNYEV